MTKLTFGTGRINVGRGHDTEGEHRSRYLFLTDTGKERPVGSITGHAPDSVNPTRLEDHDVVIEFLTLESARVLADKLNLLVCRWDEEQAFQAHPTATPAFERNPCLLSREERAEKDHPSIKHEKEVQP